MRVAITSLLFVVAITCSLADNNAPHYDIEKAPQLFEKFIQDFKRVYKNEADKQVHYQAFVKTLIQINKWNSEPGQTATFGINKFADYTEEEKKHMGGFVPIKQ
ncbi:uncharacterized protein LOC128673861 [Plodia interpunctella]|uniref:uncharacterized protein LOC128673861 n=1 Tax=Plodia interpunctella TaxID=58824 RepID=UPI0023681816|nr:uncharacterized protein LOC128673861 [Plodia interpunctella]